MKNKRNRLISLLCAVCMMCTLIQPAFAAKVAPSGDVKWAVGGNDAYTRLGGSAMATVTYNATPGLVWGCGDTFTYDTTKAYFDNDGYSNDSLYGGVMNVDKFAFALVASLIPQNTGDANFLFKNVTGDPDLVIFPRMEKLQFNYDAYNFTMIPLAENEVSYNAIDMPTVRLVYDVDVSAGANGSVAFQSALYFDAEAEEYYQYLRAQGLNHRDASALMVEGKNFFNDDAPEANYTAAGLGSVTAADTAQTTQWAVGKDLVFTVTPNTNYEVDAVTATLNGTDIPTYFTDNGDGTYTLNLPETAITAATDKVEINATFKGAGQSITSSVEGGNGTISPLGEQSVPYGADQTFTMTPEDKYCVDTVTVNENGESKTHHTTASEIYDAATGTWSYTFKEVKTSGSIVVKYAPDQNGDKIPDNRQAFLTFTADANGAFDAATVPADATGVDKAKSYTIVRNKEKNGVVAADGGYTVVEADIATPVAANGYAFDLWKNGNTNLTVCDPKAPTGQFVTGNTTFTATFAASEDGVIPDKYKMKFIFTLDANSQFADDSGDAQKTATAVKYDDANNPSLTGTATISADMIPAVEGKFGYAFKEWFSTAMTPNTATDLEGKTFQGSGEADEVEIQAVAQNAAAVLHVVEESDVATGTWNNDETFTFTVQLRIGDKAATENEIKAIKLDKGALYRGNAGDFPSAASDASEYLTLAAPVFEAGSYQKVTVEGAEYGQMTMTLTKDSLFRSSIATFTASYDDGVTGSNNNKDTFVTIIPGDVNRDGNVAGADSIAIAQSFAQYESDIFDAKYATELMDVNGDGNVAAVDGNVIQRMLAQEFPSN